MGSRAILRASCLAMVLGFAGAATWAHGQQTIRLADDRHVPAQGETEFRFELGPIPPGQQVRLGLDARIEWEDLGGSTGAMVAYANGEGLAGRHLVNKPLTYSMRNDVELAWGSEDGCGYRLMYSPDFSDRIKTDEGYEYGVPDTDPYRFVWDITSYVKPGGNTVKIGAVQGLALSLSLRDVVVEVSEPLPPLPRAAPSGETPEAEGPDAPLRVYVPKRPATLPAGIETSSSGGIRFSTGGRRFVVTSRTSLPDGRWSDRDDPQAEWTRLRRGASTTVTWREAQYSVERRITVHADRIAVADTIVNTGDELLGVMVEHRLVLPKAPERTYLAGNLVKRLKQRSSPAHPTAIVQHENLALGLVAEDDIFRIHSKASVEERALALADPQLGLSPHATHTLEWSIYVVRGGDYWDVINAVRRNWGVNVTLRGPSRWVHPAGVPGTAESAREWLGKASMVVLCNPTFGTEEERAKGICIQHGTALPLCEGWCELAADRVRVLRDARPEVETFIYTHQNLCTEPGHENKYLDSCAVDITGKRATTVYSPSPSLFVPTSENSYGKALMVVARLVAERLDANVYIDEITASNVPAFGSYDNAWDGCTVAIDPVSHAVTGKRSSAVLLMQPWREALMAYLKDRGKTVIANGPFYTRTMMGWGLQCFVEAEPGDSAAVAAQLSHPLCLASYSSTDARLQTEIARRMLDQAGISFAPFCSEAPLYPITPVELRAGVVIGEERILTNRSGQFGWGDGSSADVYVFDPEGRRVASPDARELREGRRVVTELRMPADHLGVLVRERG